ncbi:MAG: Enoyl-CoA hydratase/isomerase, partial [Aliidongia sp.]|nr:Enoyl-CoA hydratase/isomerase [Aliidongia sp.]
MSADPILLRERRGSVAWLTLNRPAARNALSRGLMTALESALDDAATDP